MGVLDISEGADETIITTNLKRGKTRFQKRSSFNYWGGGGGGERERERGWAKATIHELKPDLMLNSVEGVCTSTLIIIFLLLPLLFIIDYHHY